MSVNKPIGVFDAGIGSYAIVEKIRKSYPSQDIVYLADRKSFPYGAKDHGELLTVTRQATEYLFQYGCSAVVLASNAPSIVVMEDLLKLASLLVIGVLPPVKEACRHSMTRNIAVLGVRSMVESPEFKKYVIENTLEGCAISGINASELVDLVEDFSFLNDHEKTQRVVSKFLEKQLETQPNIDVMTMSSTHLPWLKAFFLQAQPQITFLDPADSVIEEIRPYVTHGDGIIDCIATESPQFPIKTFNEALLGLKTGLIAKLIHIGN